MAKVQVQTVTTKSYTLSLTEEEAGLIYALVGRCSGRANVVMAIYSALKASGVKHPDGLRIKAQDYTGSRLDGDATIFLHDGNSVPHVQV